MTVDVVYGFLGSGKTTFIARVLQEWGDREQIVVLVNEFGEVGIDGAILKGLGGDVVEMPGGCICCTLQPMFRSQLLEIYETFRPHRVIVEPTGVATLAQIRSILEAKVLEEAIERVHYILVADATNFLDFYKASPHFVESQTKGAHLVLLNKCDRVERKRTALVRSAVSSLNAEAAVLMTEFGAVDWSQYQASLDLVDSSPAASAAQLMPGLYSAQNAPDGGLFGIHAEKDELGLESLGLVYREASFDLDKLERIFEQLNDARFGEVARAKGIFKVAGRWMLLELASGEFSSQMVREVETSRVSVIGRNLKREEIRAVFEQSLTI